MKLRTASIPSGWFLSRIRSGHARCGREGRWISSVWNKQTSVKQKKKGKGSPHNVEGVYTNSKWKQYSFVILSRRCWSSVGLGVMVGVGDRLPPQPLIMTGSADWLLWSNVEPGRERVGVGVGMGGGRSPSTGESQQGISKEEAVSITPRLDTGGVSLIPNSCLFSSVRL